MKFYENRVLPHLIHWACGQREIIDQRERVVPQAAGRVLEVGMGSGLNLPHYDRSRVELVWGLEPSEGMRRKAARSVEDSDLEVRWLAAGAEMIPLEDSEVDTVVLTYTLCTIPAWREAIAEMRRVLRPGGRLFFVEHGLSPDEAVARWQRRIEPVWKPIAGGCHLTRPTVPALEEGGFHVEQSESLYLKGPRWATYNTLGTARLA